MSKRDSRINDYISGSSPFARPILKHLRMLVHEAGPDLEENIKWGMPAFTWNGKLVCHIAAFKQHCALSIWRAEDIVDEPDSGAMGQFGRITALDDLPSDEAIQSLIHKRITSYQDSKSAVRPKRRKAPLRIPLDLKKALACNDRARTVFQGFSESQRREYVEWIDEAKRDATRQKRLATTMKWLTEGKPRNWKYQNRERRPESGKRS